jgi:hypothetical protein
MKTERKAGSNEAGITLPITNVRKREQSDASNLSQPE